jgi:hypothetical protein
VTLDAHIVRGPHDEYLIAEHCAGSAAAEPYIYFTYDPRRPALKEFHKLFSARANVKNCNDCFKYDVSGLLTGYVKKAPSGGFGAISADVGIEITQIDKIRKKRIKVDDAHHDSAP